MVESLGMFGMVESKELQQDRERYKEIQNKGFEAISNYDKTISSSNAVAGLTTAVKLKNNHITYQEKKEGIKKPLEINDKYFFDLRFWNKEYDVEKFVKDILEGKASSNAGNQDYRIKESGMEVSEVVKMVKDKMIWGVTEMRNLWKSEMNGNYLKTYGIEHFKNLFDYYVECEKFLTGNTPDFEVVLSKAKQEVLESIKKEVEKAEDELDKLISKQIKYERELR